MIAAKTPGFIKRLYYSLHWNLGREDKCIYLTFDDGPTPEITLQTLGLLRQFQAKATFFCLGRNVERYPGIYNRIIEGGHMVGNHTYSHLKGWYTGNEEYFKDIELARLFISSRLFRPPYGRIKRSQLKYLKQFYSIIMWDVMSFDYSHKVTKEQCKELVLKYTAPGSIVVFHDSVKAGENMLYALENVLQHFTQRGFAFKRIEDYQPLFNA